VASPSKLKSEILARVLYALGAFIFNSGMGRWQKKLHDFSMNCLQRAANAGHGQALLMAGQILTHRGEGISSRQAGIKYLRTAAGMGNPDAQFMLAQAMCDEALGLNHDDEDILTLYKKAANQGHIMAALRLKKAYTDGLWGVSVDEAQASYWSEQFMKSSK